MVKFFVTVAFLLLNTVPLSAQSASEGKDAANRGDFARALRIWMPLADKGDVESQFNLGRMYARGDGVQRDLKEAAYWFEKAAKNGHLGSAERLSHMYEVGDGVQRDMARARYWKDASRGKPVEQKRDAEREVPREVKSTPAPQEETPTPYVPPPPSRNEDTAVKLPQGTIQEGSLCNKKLMMDTQPAVAGKAAMLGCNKIDSFKPYVVKNPVGPIGSKVWEERWVAKGCGTSYDVNIKFSEDGVGGAYYTIP
jgi:hypothetical protein